MRHHLIKSVLLLTFVLAPLSGYGGEVTTGPQSPITPASPAPRTYPKIVLYSVSWCPHCKAAKAYLTSHDIPFINRDVELDGDAMKELTGKYKSTGVPVIVIGNDEKVLKGFSPEGLEKAIREVQEQK
jgi:glutaredoxin-like YruB-family protein